MRYYILSILILAFTFSCTNSAEETTTDSLTESIQEAELDSLRWLNEQIIANPNDLSLYLAKSRYFVRNNDLKNAIAELDRCIAADSQNVAYYNLKGNLLYQQNNLLDARSNFEKVLSLDEKNENANIKMAWISLIAGKHEECFVYANNALKQNPYLPEPYYLKGLAYKELGNFKLSVSNFRTATEQDNDYIEAWLQLGNLYDLAEDTLAGAFYENALRIDSNNIDALYSFAMHLQKWNFTTEAISTYEKIIAIDPSYHNAYYNIGYIYLEMTHKNDSAVIFYDNVLRLNPYNYKAYYNRGLAYEREGNVQKARENYQKSLEIKPDYDLAAKGMSRVQG